MMRAERSAMHSSTNRSRMVPSIDIRMGDRRTPEAVDERMGVRPSYGLVEERVGVRGAPGADDARVVARRMFGAVEEREGVRGASGANDERMGVRRRTRAVDERVIDRRSPGAKAAGLVRRSPLKGLNGWSMRREYNRSTTVGHAISGRAKRQAYSSGAPGRRPLTSQRFRQPSTFSGLRLLSPAALAPGDRRTTTRSSFAPNILRTATRSSFASGIRRSPIRSSTAPICLQCITTVSPYLPVFEVRGRAK